LTQPSLFHYACAEQGLRSQHAYIAALSTAQEAERSRLARELHDEVVPQLIALGHGVDRTQRLLDRDPSQVAERLQTMREASQHWLASCGRSSAIYARPHWRN